MSLDTRKAVFRVLGWSREANLSLSLAKDLHLICAAALALEDFLGRAEQISKRDEFADLQPINTKVADFSAEFKKEVGMDEIEADSCAT